MGRVRQLGKQVSWNGGQDTNYHMHDRKYTEDANQETILSSTGLRSARFLVECQVTT